MFHKKCKTWQCPLGFHPKKVCVTTSFSQKGEKTLKAGYRIFGRRLQANDPLDCGKVSL